MTSSPGWTHGRDRVEDRFGAAGRDRDLGVRIVAARRGTSSYFAAIASRSAGTPCIGAYWLRPARMCRATASTSAGIAVEVRETPATG